MVAYGASKAFDMVFAEALWSELHDKGIDVIGLILGKTDTPALRKLEHERGTLASEDESPADAVPVGEVVDEAFANLTNGPTVLVGEQMRTVGQLLASMNRNDAARLMAQSIATAMGPD
jgi:short-subunit dehydrogenase